MALEILRKEEQVDGQFNGGAILEKRPVVYESGKTFPYSNLFYWAHAWSEKGSTIGLHPHQGFEIMSFVLKGSIEHYDTKNKSWMPLNAGDVQIIRSGNGISHAEKLNPNSSIFQIWFDPNLNNSLSVPATYDDYKSETLPVIQQNGITSKIFIGENSPVKMTAEGVSIKELMIKKGNHQLDLSATSIYSCFLLEGNLKIGELKIDTEDFFKVQG
ncbi:MAG: pirin family protein, partial [Chitinophagales bacterium]|nr:pirin family protein [Chitinophagales bacterium]